MKKKSLSPTHSLFIIFCMCLFLTAMSMKADLNGRFDSGKTYREEGGISSEQEEEAGDFMIWELLSHHLLTFNR